MSKIQSDNEFFQGKLAEILLTDAYYTYELDVTTGMIMKDIVGRDGYNYTKSAQFASPCLFDDMVQQALYGDKSYVEFTIDSSVQELSCKALLEAYRAGKRRVEVKLHSRQPHAYHRLTFVLERSEQTDHVMACA